MKSIVATLILATALPAAAGARDLGETGSTASSVQADTSDPCMLMAAVRASYTAARNDEIYGIARSQCGHRRVERDPAEVEVAATWSRLIAGLRDRRRQHDALYGIVEVAAR